MNRRYDVIEILKTDLFGRVELVRDRSEPESVLLVRRDTRCARPWLRPVARALAAREAASLSALTGMAGVPGLVSWRDGVLLRTWIQGRPMQVARPRERGYFRHGLGLLRRMHRAGVVHNDLAKEPNWLVTTSQDPAILDFQLAWRTRRRGPLFRMLAREDLRHMLKHKRTYCPDALTARQRRILDTPSWLTRLWKATGKRVYLLVTRRILGWADREGAGDRSL